ncbi:phospholipase D-like domain-containing anti-phage protein [Clostridium perfringens]|uniref:phospholipase D-like domain-containing anti-phage protein n=1 Tax=Clostridium perfringens TaxID=1502 RepID=UPI0008A6D5AC|nr:phospholipase D-like domain-containing anti-phage protein [Clostridium perfringens]AOY54874.1 helicase domain protein [Clostridium perfringens]MDK0857945.1 phospholipase D-like domain-containing protein [Clostridium perfringens]MDM0549706.1 phospholipase D-like domain-containing protein [Clostridium perfringens]MDM0590158.1 phospholipase D-like domain-containing protein [Clostridium perfringens]MDU6982161.1 phospholipase D-like domain-containing anti-phage protein [Clostridium perfringens]
MLRKYSSRREKLNEAFLNDKLKGAKAYDRIAGYFSSSILELSFEEIENMEGIVRVVCNSDLNVEDVATATLAKNSLRKEWCEFKPEEIPFKSTKRLERLYNLLKSNKLQVRVIPNKIFGLIHGKAGVITLKDGRKTAFLGSVNETLSAWKLNYEILWEEDSKETIQWVQEEFDSLWYSSYAVPLSDFIIEDIERISKRYKLENVEEWNEDPNPASVIVESPVYRKEYGLWEHQKYFVDLAFRDHKKGYGARYVLADMVGLGKTIQLAFTAQLMALYGEKSILIIVPKTLMWQWQEEMNTLLDMPSAVWNGREWIDENGLTYPSEGAKSIKKCPRRVGIVSQGLITAKSECVQYLLSTEYECVIIDEAHRARRKNLGEGKENDKPIPNNLMDFLLKISMNTKSMLLATATPVQLYPIECWDLLNILSQKNDSVLGNRFSRWRANSKRALDLVMGKDKLDEVGIESWEWLKNPFPPAKEDEATFGRIRRRLDMDEETFVAPSEALMILNRYPAERRKIGRIMERGFVEKNNPFIRHIVRRTRDFLENEINPDTNEPYLKKIEIELLGENEDEAISLPIYLQEAYGYAEEFSRLLSKRVKGGGFIKTLLLKRIGSTMIAGENTAKKMLRWGMSIDDDYEDSEVELTEVKELTDEERECLRKFIKTIERNKEKDPKYNLVLDLLIKNGWKKKGCIIFSQYFDSAFWVAENLSKDIMGEVIGLYAGGDKSGIIQDGIYIKKTKEEIKAMVKSYEIKILLGTDAASEGLNLQTLGSLINLDLPWNPTRLEQRKGRIQRIGQINDKIYIYNMRYKNSVEDKVHSMLSERLESIHNMFGQIPDILEDVWIDIALGNIEKANKIIGEIPKYHPFQLRYERGVGKVNWESCTKVLDKVEKRKYLMNPW